MEQIFFAESSSVGRCERWSCGQRRSHRCRFWALLYNIPGLLIVIYLTFKLSHIKCILAYTLFVLWSNKYLTHDSLFFSEWEKSLLLCLQDKFIELKIFLMFSIFRIKD